MLTNNNIVDLIDEYIKKQEKEYLAPGEKPPKGVNIKIGPKGGKFYISERTPKISEIVDKDVLRRQYAAFKTRQKGKLMDAQEKKFVEDTLGKLNKLSTEDLKAYFQEQYAKVKGEDVQKVWPVFSSELEKINKTISIRTSSDLNNTLKKLYKRYHIGLTPEIKELAYFSKIIRDIEFNFHPENDYLHKINGWIQGGIKNLKNKGDEKLLEYALERFTYHFSGMDPNNKIEFAKFLVGDPYSESFLLKKIEYFRNYVNKNVDAKENYNRFILALTPHISTISSGHIKYQKPIYDAFVKKDWNRAEKLVKTTKYYIAR